MVLKSEQHYVNKTVTNLVKIAPDTFIKCLNTRGAISATNGDRASLSKNWNAFLLHSQLNWDTLREYQKQPPVVLCKKRCS